MLATRVTKNIPEDQRSTETNKIAWHSWQQLATQQQIKSGSSTSSDRQGAPDRNRSMGKLVCIASENF